VGSSQQPPGFVLCFGLSVLLALLCVFCEFVGLFGALCGLVCVRSCLCLRGVFNLAWRVTEGAAAIVES
jgi:hypothetical protein